MGELIADRFSKDARSAIVSAPTLGDCDTSVLQSTSANALQRPAQTQGAGRYASDVESDTVSARRSLLPLRFRRGVTSREPSTGRIRRVVCSSTRNPPFSRLDLVSCRNLLIYLDATAQRRLMQVFHYSLCPKEFLLLGPSESVGIASDASRAPRHPRQIDNSSTGA